MLATTTEYLSDAVGCFLTTDQVWSAAVPVELTFASTMTPNLSTMINAYVVLTGNFTLNKPTNVKPGQFGVIELIQDATGSRIITFGSGWNFPGGNVPVLTTTANAVDLLYYYVDHGSNIRGGLVKDT